MANRRPLSLQERLDLQEKPRSVESASEPELEETELVSDAASDLSWRRPQPLLVAVPRRALGPTPGLAESRPRLTSNLNVLSWDCGLRNLCYCLLEDTGDEKEFRVLMWQNFSLNSQTMKQAVEVLVRELDARPWMMDVDYVCIESQVLRNTQMKTMSHVIQTYFVTRGNARLRETSRVLDSGVGRSRVVVRQRGHCGPSVHFVAAQSKFKVGEHVPIPESVQAMKRRQRNKRVAEIIAEHLLEERGYKTPLKYLKSFDKRDDLSDSLLQGIYFLRVMRKRADQKNRVAHHLTSMRGCLEIDEDATMADRNHEELNEGCEYESEMPLPQLYKCERFVIPRYDFGTADICRARTYPRQENVPDKWQVEEGLVPEDEGSARD